MTLYPDFAGMPLFTFEYLRNATRQRHSYNGTLTGTCTWCDTVVWLLITLSDSSDLAICQITWSVA